MNSTYVVLEAKLAVPIGSFKEEEPTEQLQVPGEQQLSQKPSAKDLRPNTRESEAMKSVGRSSEASMAKFNARIEPDFTLTKLKENPADAIYERMIIVVPYRAADKVKMVEATFE